MGFAEDIVARARGDLSRAERDAASAREKLLRAEAEIADLQAFLRKLDHYAGPVSASSANPVMRALVARKRLVAGGKSRELVDVAIDRIQRAGARVPIADLLEEILQRGLEIGGKDEKSNLAGYLSRDPRVDYVKPDGWGLVTEGAASRLAGTDAAPSLVKEESYDGPTLAFPDDHSDLA